MTLQQFQYVIAICETGSFSKAAEQLYMSQPSLTSAVKALEEELGIQFFVRYVWTAYRIIYIKYIVMLELDVIKGTV